MYKGFQKTKIPFLCWKMGEMHQSETENVKIGKPAYFGFSNASIIYYLNSFILRLSILKDKRGRIDLLDNCYFLACYVLE
ncbi:MAG TPA: hypothetical protein DEO71_03985 [Chryseobacterium sp.]|nr:hypothetical protein [Chryseobacterium sp.]